MTHKENKKFPARMVIYVYGNDYLHVEMLHGNIRIYEWKLSFYQNQQILQKIAEELSENVELACSAPIVHLVCRELGHITTSEVSAEWKKFLDVLSKVTMYAM